MTLSELSALISERTRCLDMGRTHGKPLRELDPIERARQDRNSDRFWELDRAIVAELHRHGAPVVIGKVEYALLADGLSFVALDAATGVPAIYLTHRSKADRSVPQLYVYPKAGAGQAVAG